MTTEPRLRHGFKAESERRAINYRSKLELVGHEALPARRLAEHLGTHIISPVDVPGLGSEHLKILTQSNTGWWSAGILHHEGRTVIVLNTLHALQRQESSIMHELSHSICKHKSAGVETVGGFPLRTYNPEHEEEASYLGACLQVPRDGLYWAIKQGMTTSQIAEYFGASEQIIRYRRNVTGIDTQLRRSSVKRRPRHTC